MRVFRIRIQPRRVTKYLFCFDTADSYFLKSAINSINFVDIRSKINLRQLIFVNHICRILFNLAIG